MKKSLYGALIVLSAGSTAMAGGLDRSGQGVSALFKSGNYLEFSAGYVSPNASGTLGAPSGDVTPNYIQFGMAYKTQLNDKLALAVIVDQPFGASIDYIDANANGYPLPAVKANLSSMAVSALANYRFNDRFSVHGGLRFVNMNGRIDTPAAYFDYEGMTGLGYVVGAAYEIPDIALRAALTYSSAISYENDILINGTIPGGTLDYTMPQSVNLDLQTGIAENTLLFGSVRWVDWPQTEITTPIGVIDYDQAVITYTLGVGRKFSDRFSGAVSVGYEASDGEPASDLSPTDGRISLTVGGTYAMNEVDIQGGVSVAWLGDATTESGAAFSDNMAVGVGIKISRSW